MRSKASLALALIIMVCSGAAVYIAQGWPWKAALFPMAIGIPVFCLAVVEVLWGLLGPAAAKGTAMDFEIADDVPPKIAARRTLEAAAWMLGFLAAIALLSFPVAAPLFVFVYLRFRGRESWVFTLLFTLVVWGFFYLVFQRLLNLPFPNGWIQGWLGF